MFHDETLTGRRNVMAFDLNVLRPKTQRTSLAVCAMLLDNSAGVHSVGPRQVLL
jgi:hypothetical protein